MTLFRCFAFALGLASGFTGGAAPLWAETQIYRFVWQGAGGYAMEGAMAFDADRLDGPLVRAPDVTCFAITGTLNGAPIGSWRLTQLGPDTTWRLHFDPAREAFVVEGEGIRMPQAWNMNGRGDDCGSEGFGFNLGNLGQDICLRNRLIVGSRVPPETPFPAVRDDGFAFPRGACNRPALLGALTRRPGPS